MFRAYLDESAERRDAVFAVGGFVGREEEWLELEPAWIAALPHKIKYFHATECFGGRCQFDGIPIPDRVALLERLTDLIAARNIRLIAGVIDVPAYIRFAPKHLQNEFLGNKYAAPFGAAVEYACQFMNRPNDPFPHDVDDLCAFFIEENEYRDSAVRALESIKNSPDLWWRNRIGSTTFGTKNGPGAISLLQVADFGAFLAAKKIAGAPDGKIPWTKCFDKLCRANRVFKIIHVDETSINKLHDLHEELKREATEGKDPWGDI